MLCSIIDQPFIHLITDTKNIVFFAQICNKLKFFQAKNLQQKRNLQLISGIKIIVMKKVKEKLNYYRLRKKEKARELFLKGHIHRVNQNDFLEINFAKICFRGKLYEY